MRRRIMRIIIMLLSIFLSYSVSFAKLRVVATYPYIADITEKIGKDRISVSALARGSRDPHHIVARPSIIAKIRRADLLIINGAELEIGWVPPILRDSRNPRIQPGSSGFIELSTSMELIQVPDKVSRALGDVHPAGNPHFVTSPGNVLIIARVIMKRLCEIDGENGEFYTKNFNEFKALWQEKIAEWRESLKAMKGMKVIQYHRNLDYFLKYFGIISVGEMEPLPGIPPTSKHIIKTIEKVKTEGVKLILNDVYHSTGPARFVSDRTGIKFVVMPHDIGAVEEAKDIVSLFDEIVRRLKK
jgi:zinc/manganese transport system substrate-binding protein